MEPLEWVDALDKELTRRCAKIATWRNYYNGTQPLAFASEKFREAFGGLFKEFADNWCATVVNAVDERLAITGFRFGKNPGADEEAWRMWQANHMDAESKLAIKAALIDARSFVLVWPNADDPTTPIMTVESADQCIVAYEPGSRYLRTAALKRWRDEWSGKIFATLYLPDAIYKYQEADKPTGQIVRPALVPIWVPRVVRDEPWPLPNPHGVVPIVEIRNDPRLACEPRSELESVIPLQDVVNKLVTDMVVASEFGAFKQKWMIGAEIPVDPATNQPVEEWKIAVSRLLRAPGAEGSEEQPTAFGEFSETQLSNFVTAIDMIVSHVASQSRTPPHYLSASADRLSGESIKSAETGLVSKARDKHLHMGEGFEEAQILAFLMRGDARADFVGAEVIWKDPETRSEAEHMDALTKKQSLGVPWEQLMEDADYSPVQIQRFKSMLAAQALMFPAEPPVTPGPPTVPGAPESPPPGAPAGG